MFHYTYRVKSLLVPSQHSCIIREKNVYLSRRDVILQLIIPTRVNQYHTANVIASLQSKFFATSFYLLFLCSPSFQRVLFPGRLIAQLQLCSHHVRIDNRMTVVALRYSVFLCFREGVFTLRSVLEELVETALGKFTKDT